jgi:membrane-bound lytic murein transglycosylase D
MSIPKVPTALACLCLSLAVLAGCASSPGTTSEPIPPAASTPEAAEPPAVPEAPLSAVPTPDVPAEPEGPAPTPPAVDPLRPDVRLDLDDRAAQLDLWSRLRAGFAMPELDTALVRDRGAGTPRGRPRAA